MSGHVADRRSIVSPTASVPMRRMTTTIVALLATAALLTGCGGTVPTGDELVTQGRENFTTFMQSVAAVQREIADEPWDVTLYGDVPTRCGDASYGFRLDRRFPVSESGEWRINGGAEQQAADLAAWLSDAGYTVDQRENTAGVRASIIEASNRDAGIGELTVQLFPGEATDSVTIVAQSVCHAGDAFDLMTQIYPSIATPQGRTDFSNYPVTETPGDPIVFGE